MMSTESRQTPQVPAPDAPDIQGEGNYEAARRYDKSASDFAHSGKVDEAAQAAKPRDIKEADQMERAERMGKAHSKGDLKEDLAPQGAEQATAHPRVKP